MILVVDDDQPTARYVADILRDAGYTVQIAHHGQDGLHKLQQSAPLPCLILLDVLMPVMDGWTFRRQQQQDPRLAAVPVVFMAAADAQAQALQLGGDFLKKPFTEADILAKAAQYCGPVP